MLNKTKTIKTTITTKEMYNDNTNSKFFQAIMEFLILISLLLNLVLIIALRFDKIMVFFILIFTGILMWIFGLYMIKIKNTETIVCIISLYYYWILHSFVSLLLDDFLMLSDWIIDIFFIVFYIIVFILLYTNIVYAHWIRFIMLNFVIVVVSAIPIFDHNAFLDIWTGIIRMLALIIVYSIIQYKEYNKQIIGTRIVSQIFYIFFSSLVPLLILFVIQILLLISSLKRKQTTSEIIVIDEKPTVIEKIEERKVIQSNRKPTSTKTHEKQHTIKSSNDGRFDDIDPYTV